MALPTDLPTAVYRSYVDVSNGVTSVRTSPAGGTNGAYGAVLTPAAAGASGANFVRNDYTSTNVTTSAYVQLVASTAVEIHSLEIFDSSGSTLKIAIGAAASEVDQFLVFPGGNGRRDIVIPAGQRISIKAVSATASVGELSINFSKVYGT